MFMYMHACVRVCVHVCVRVRVRVCVYYSICVRIDRTDSCLLFGYSIKKYIQCSFSVGTPFS